MTGTDSRPEVRYFEWLYGLVADPYETDPEETYYSLLALMNNQRFLDFVGNDHNRAEDGKMLRDEFCDVDLGSWPDTHMSFIFQPCTMLELLIGIARRAAFETEGSSLDLDVDGWFWELVRNLGLIDFSDANWNAPNNHSRSTLRRVLKRLYSPSGEGGLFPLRNPKKDQRKVELWYQMNAYILENTEWFDED